MALQTRPRWRHVLFCGLVSSHLTRRCVQVIQPCEAPRLTIVTDVVHGRPSMLGNCFCLVSTNGYHQNKCAVMATFDDGTEDQSGLGTMSQKYKVATSSGS